MKKWRKVVTALAVMAALCTMFSFTVFAVTKDAAPGKVSGLKQTEATESSVGFSWSTAVGCAKGYYAVQSSVDGINWTTVDDSSSGCNDTISGLSSGTTLYVRVAAYSGYSWSSTSTLGEYSDPLQVITSPTKVTGVTQTTATANSVTLIWNAVEGAEYYNIHSDDSGKTVIATSNVPSITISGLSTNAVARYYVSAVKKSASGFLTSSELGYSWSGTNAEVKTLPAKMSSDSFGISNFWSALGQINFARNTPTNAEGTQLEVRRVKTNKQVWTSDSSMYFKYNNNIAYKYRVRAYITIGDQRAYGPWSSYRYFSPQKVQAQKKGKAIKATWKKIDKASKYTIYISTASESGYKKVKTVTSAKNSLTITKIGKKKLKKGQTYYVKVLATIKNGKKTYKSEVYNYVSCTYK